MFIYMLSLYQMKPSDLQEIIEIIVSKLPEVNKENPENIQQIKQYWRATVNYIIERKNAGHLHYSGLTVPM